MTEVRRWRRRLAGGVLERHHPLLERSPGGLSWPRSSHCPCFRRACRGTPSWALSHLKEAQTQVEVVLQSSAGAPAAFTLQQPPQLCLLLQARLQVEELAVPPVDRVIGHARRMLAGRQQRLHVVGARREAAWVLTAHRRLVLETNRTQARDAEAAEQHR